MVKSVLALAACMVVGWIGSATRAFADGDLGAQFIPLGPKVLIDQKNGRSYTDVFEIQTTDVTQAQWVQVMGANPSRFQNREDCRDNFTQIRGVPLCPKHPVESVTYDDVQAFLARVNGSTHDGYRYRLPTNPEWEYASRGATEAAYPYGPDDHPGDDFFQYYWVQENSGAHTHDVALLKPSSLGLYDLNGNVGQWVDDWFCEDSDISDDSDGDCIGRLVRGRGFLAQADSVKAANADYDTPDHFHSLDPAETGFRLARSKGPSAFSRFQFPRF